MIRLAQILRFVMLVASLGVAFGALLMFWLGGTKLASGMNSVFLPEGAGAKLLVTAVMEATDAFLFGLVLIAFAYGIAFSFAFDLPRAVMAKLPAWMRIDGLVEFKNTLIEIILVYLIVDFATDIAEVEANVSWGMLSKPVAIALIAASLRLLRHTRVADYPHADGGPERPPNPSNR